MKVRSKVLRSLSSGGASMSKCHTSLASDKASYIPSAKGMPARSVAMLTEQKGGCCRRALGGGRRVKGEAGEGRASGACLQGHVCKQRMTLQQSNVEHTAAGVVQEGGREGPWGGRRIEGEAGKGEGGLRSKMEGAEGRGRREGVW